MTKRVAGSIPFKAGMSSKPSLRYRPMPLALFATFALEKYENGAKNDSRAYDYGHPDGLPEEGVRTRAVRNRTLRPNGA